LPVSDASTAAGRPEECNTVEELRAMNPQAAESAAGLRDRAILLIGFAGAFRRRS